jgi:hypothetical protein
MLIAALLTSHTFAGSFPKYDQPASAVTANVGSTVITRPPFNNSLTLGTVNPSKGYSFYAYIDVINVTSFGAYSIGFTWNYTFVQVTNITDGGFLTSVKGSSATGLTPFTINNTIGEVEAVANAIETPSLAPTGSGHLLKVGFEINPALSYAGGPVALMHFNTSSSSPYQLSIASNDTTIVTPNATYVYDGTLTVSSVVPEFPFVLFASLLVSVTLAVALVERVAWSRKRQRLNHSKQPNTLCPLQT